MIVYIANYLLIPFYALLFGKNKKIFCFISCIQLFFVLALRNPLMGVDVGIYSSGYKYIGQFSFTELLSRLTFLSDAHLKVPYKFESGWTLLNWIFYNIGFNYHCFMVFLAFINIYAFGRFIYKYSEDAELSFLIFLAFNFFTYCFCILRQSLAISFLLIAIDSILEKKRVKSFVIFLIAFSIQKVSIVFFPMLFINEIKQSKKRIFICIILLIIEFFIVKKFFSYIFLLLVLLGKGYESTHITINSLYLLIWCVVIAVYFNIDKFDLNNRMSNLSIWGILLALAIETIGLAQDVIARAAEVGLIFLILLVPKLLNYTFNNALYRLEIKLLAVFFLFAFMFHNIQGSYLDPYLFY